ncbi:hypothetical protein F0562_015119 [Nyssa sinensis]|uniref:DUF7356 domain-containing protein n=1 Tax=Nyssa sinensis TaxID=561372 RepID=A0A5J4ZHS1_9ASTE|nr:hypothetical protein F0562_015119 [Nyssa sinensis]
MVSVSLTNGQNTRIVLNAGNGDCVLHMGSAFRKRGRQVGVPYQELEMGLPESASAVNVDTAEGWDQGWDEDNAVKLPGGRHVGNISANGLTSGSS